jgi:predicted ribosome quality control (RQC) complex YloA/Tae2 family protein
MSDLNIHKRDSDASWVNANVESGPQKKIETDKAHLAETYASTIVKSQEQKTDQDRAIEAKSPKLALPNPDAADPAELSQFLSPQNLKEGNEKVLWSFSKWEVPGATKEEQARYANVKVSDPTILQLAEKLGLPPGLVLKNLQTEYNFFFEAALKQGVPPEEANQLIFAHYYPEYATKLSSEQKALLLKFQNDTSKALNQKQGFPDRVHRNPI